MTPAALILQAIEIMFIGMGVVVTLLAVLVLCTYIMSLSLRASRLEDESEDTVIQTTQTSHSEMHVAAVVAATEHHRRLRSR